MKNWLCESIGRMSLTDEVEEYLLSRGAQDHRIEKCVTWDSEKVEDDPAVFSNRYGIRGGALDGCLVTPYWDAKAACLGFEARRLGVANKWVSDFRLEPRSKWFPIGIGYLESSKRLHRRTDIWLVEGQFDLYALDWFLPDDVASFATVKAGLSYHHVMWLQRFVRRKVYICYDNDETGRAAAQKDNRWLSKLRVPCEIVSYQGGKDPGEIWDAGGSEAVKQAFSRYY